MKKKIIMIAVTASLMLTGVVSAASMWGTYKGNDIIRITSNGVALKTSDVPAISYNGRTMIPISMLGQIGLGYNWDQANKTVDIGNVSTNAIPSITMDNIKNDVKYADFFHNLESLGESLNGVNANYYNVANSIISNSTTSSDQLSKANENLNSIITFYNATVAESKKYIDSNVSSIMQDYFSAIDYYKLMDTALHDFLSNKSQQNFNTFTSNNSLAINASVKGTLQANKKYSEYINKVLNAK
jgi:hypothetical protein